MSAQDKKLTRADFLKVAGVTGVAGAFLGSQSNVMEAFKKTEEGTAYILSDPERQLYSVCQQCNTQCGIKVKVIDGVAVKIEGNPYSPWNLVPHVPYSTSVKEMAKLDAPLCPKGQSGIQSAYDPYRLKQVLKRAGKRGENKWVTIPFDQAITEIVEGGQLFANVPGEENRTVEGLRALRVVTDPKLMKALGDAAKAILAEKDLEKKKALVEQFKVDHAEHLDKMIDPDHPDFGPKNNQILYFWGRQKAGRADFINRLFGSGLGTTNRHGHTTVCQGSLYFSGKSMSDQWDGSKFTGGSKAYWMGDTASADFVIFVGSSPFEGNYGPTNRAPRITERLASGRMKFAVIDPRLSKIGGKAWKWLPNKPGSEAAIALAMIQWVIDNQRYDAKYLALANKAAAAAAKEPTWSNASWLVKIDPATGAPGKFLRGSDLKLVEKKEGEVDGKKVVTYPAIDGSAEFKTDPFVVLDADGNPLLFDPNDDQNPAVFGQLFVDNVSIGEFVVKTSLQILKDSANQKSIEEWSEISGLRARDIIELANEFTSHGKNACVDLHRGVSQHTNGYYNVISWYNLALLIGNYDWRGGQVWISTYDLSGAKAEGPFVQGKSDPGALSPFGISLIRHDVKYEDTTIYMDLPKEQRYPAPRNWYPLASDVYEEIIPSAGDMYPYPIKAAFMYMGSPVYSLPGGHTWIEILSDVEKLPLFVASDILVGETSMYADYIFPDVTYLERWEFSGSHPNITFKVQGVRNPVIAPMTGTVKVYGQEMALQWEAMLLAIAEKLDLPNFGKNGFGEGIDLAHPDDLYLRMVMNLAYGEKKELEDAVPEASAEEIDLFLKTRAHLPKAVFDPERWQKITGELWPRVVTVLSRGGRFQAYEKGYPGDDIRPGAVDKPYVIPVGNKYGKLINMYLEKNVGIKYSGTGKEISPFATYIEPATGYDGKVIDDSAGGYDLKLITYRDIAQTKSRTPGNYWLKALLPENYLLINSLDAQARGLRDGDPVHISCASNPNGEWDLGATGKRLVQGKVKVVEGMRPGVVSFALGFGHWAYGAVDISINGTTIKGEERRFEGFHANAVMRTDPFVTNTCLFDPVGGSAVFYDTLVKVKKV
jgi:anaerobic selenocysteine-containing dehydrogenase